MSAHEQARRRYRPPDVSHPEQVRELLADAAALITDSLVRAEVERRHAEVMGLVEDEDRAWHDALGDLSGELEWRRQRDEGLGRDDEECPW